MSKETRNSEFSRKGGKSRRGKSAGKTNSGLSIGATPVAKSDAPRRSKPKPQSPDAVRRTKGMHPTPPVTAPRSPKSRQSEPKSAHKSGGQGRPGAGREGGALWIWGVHAVKAVLANPKRTIHDLMMTDNAAIRADLPAHAPMPRIVLPQMLDKQFPNGTSHQGMAVKVAPLEWPDISDIAAEEHETDGLILVLDQITDPHNVGAMLRLCSAFGVRALVMQDRKAPPLAGATAKVAVGCLETIPVCLVKNIANTLQDLQKQNWMVTGLAGETDRELSTALAGSGNKVIVMGAEGPGLRPRVRDCCDWIARIPMLSSDVHGEAESLNVATAASIALYEARRVEQTS